MTGIGRYVYNNDNNKDDVYEGNFVNGVKQGKGKMTYKTENGTESYDG